MNIVDDEPASMGTFDMCDDGGKTFQTGSHHHRLLFEWKTANLH